MSEISNINDNKTSTCDASYTKYCPLAACACSDNKELISFDEHYTTEQHQKNVVKSAKSIIEKEKSNSETDIHIKQITDHLVESYKRLSSSIQSIEIQDEMLFSLSSEVLKMKNQLPILVKRINAAKEASILQKTQINGALLNQNVLQQDVITIKEHIENKNQSTRHHVLDGTMIWKISNVREKMYDALSERRSSVYSPAFYTSATGYRLCVRLYFNGDGTARGTHLSIFLVVLRGQYDAILQWPFSYRVSFCLFDQRTLIESGQGKQAKHIIESFRPDIRSSSFQRPCSLMNMASGIPKFFSLLEFNQPPEINRYIMNDTIFIKAFIDFIGIPKSMLLFIFSLNIALPTHIQQKLIDEELKRCKQQNIN